MSGLFVVAMSLLGVGGLYGVDAGGVFCGESMFYTAPNASKLALLHLINHLQKRGAAPCSMSVGLQPAFTGHMIRRCVCPACRPARE